MPTGWHITYVDGDGKTQFSKVAIADQDAAISAVTKGRAATDVQVEPFKDGELEALAMEEGQVIYSARIN